MIVYAKNEIESGLSRISIEAEELDKTDEKGNYRRGRELNKWGANSRREDRPTMWFSIPGPDSADVFPVKNDGEEGCWRWGKKKMMAIVQRGDVDFVKRDDGTYIVYEKIRSTDPRFKPYRTFLTDTKTTADGSKEVKCLFDDKKIFNFPKPKHLLKILIEVGSTNDDDIILDFFAGSATTSHAVMDLNAEDGGNRKFICVQLPEMCDENSEASKAGYKTIADIGKERIRRVIKKIHKGKNGQIPLEDKKIDLGFKVLRLDDSNFKQWRSDIGKDVETLKKQIKMFVDPVSETATAENMVYELLLKSGKDLNSKLQHKEGYCCVNNNELVLILEKADQEIIDAVLKENPQKVIALDKLFEGNDQLKTNTALQMRDAGIEFKTI